MFVIFSLFLLIVFTFIHLLSSSFFKEIVSVPIIIHDCCFVLDRREVGRIGGRLKKRERILLRRRTQMDPKGLQ